MYKYPPIDLDRLAARHDFQVTPPACFPLTRQAP
jgi:hypothetical protein